MLLESLYVENFRGIRRLSLEHCSKVNLFLGKNNVAKTSVLEALLLFVSPHAKTWIDRIDGERGLQNGELGFKYVFYNLDPSHDIKLESKIKTIGWRKSDEVRYTLSVLISRPESSNGEQLMLPGLFADNFERGKSTEPLTRINVTAYSTEAASDGPHSATFKRERRGGRTALWRKGESGQPAPGHFGGHWMGTTLSIPDLYRRVEFLIVNKQDERLISVLQRVDSRVQGILLGADDTIYLDLGMQVKTLLPLSLMGDGMQRLLATTAMMATSGRGIVFIDEIDNGLHYSALKVLWQGIFAAATEYDVQIFSTTHSIEALRNLVDVLNEEQSRDFRSIIAAYTLIRTDDDSVRASRYGYSELEFALERGIEVRN